MKVNDENSRIRSQIGAGSISQRHDPDPDLYQSVTDPQHWP
jgi:hypothetical protein